MGTEDIVTSGEGMTAGAAWMYSVDRGWTWKRVPEGPDGRCAMPKWPAPSFRFFVPSEAGMPWPGRPVPIPREGGIRDIGHCPGDHGYDHPLAILALEEDEDRSMDMGRPVGRRTSLDILREAGFSVVRTEDAVAAGLVRPQRPNDHAAAASGSGAGRPDGSPADRT